MSKNPKNPKIPDSPFPEVELHFGMRNGRASFIFTTMEGITHEYFGTVTYSSNTGLNCRFITENKTEVDVAIDIGVDVSRKAEIDLSTGKYGFPTL